LLIALISMVKNCNLVLGLIATLNCMMALIYLVFVPMRRPLENFLMILQHGLTAALAISRQFDSGMSSNIFLVLFAAAIATMFHHGAVQIFEIFFTYDQEIERFHDPAKIGKEENEEELKEENNRHRDSNNNDFNNSKNNKRNQKDRRKSYEVIELDEENRK
jgi:hypothetical protein